MTCTEPTPPRRAGAPTGLTGLLRRYGAPYAWPVSLVVVLLVATTSGNLYLPNLNADIINNGVIKGDLGYIWRTGGVMLAVTLVLGGIAVVAVFWAARVSMAIGADLREAVFTQVQRFSAREMNDFGTPTLITRNTNDVQQIQIFVDMALTLMVIAPIMSVGGIVMALHEGRALAPLLAVVVPIMAVVVGGLLVAVTPQFSVMQTKIDRITLVLREQITGARVIRAFLRSESESRRFAEANADLTATSLRVNRVFAIGMPALMLILNLSSVAVLWFGGGLASRGTMPIGNLTAFLTYIMQILIAVMMAMMMAILIPRAMASADRIADVLGTEPAIGDGEAATTPEALTSAAGVELRAVSFGYPGSERPVLHEVSFRVPPGHTCAVIGGTGSGKSTLLNLVVRLFDVMSGVVLVDGIDVRAQPHEELWQRIALVPQSAYLFSGTVASNLRLGREDATDAELWQALTIAQARDFVASMPGGLQAPIEQGGANVSGGQRQRLAIARALVKRSHVLLLDDCFSALDAATDARLRRALHTAAMGMSVVIVAQRVSSIMDADQIVVLDEGAVVGDGTHAELMASCPAYREIVASQLGEGAA